MPKVFAAEFGQMNLGQGKVPLCFLLQYGDRPFFRGRAKGFVVGKI